MDDAKEALEAAGLCKNEEKEEDDRKQQPAAPQTGKRAICPRCQRPCPRACLCEALPDHRLSLQKCHILVLQHPHEIRRKNRSLFLAEFCLTPESLTCVRARKWQPTTASTNGNVNMGTVTKAFMSPDRAVWLVYPHAQAIPLRQALAERQASLLQSTTTTDDDDNDTPERPLTLMFLDATWKFAAEMHRASQFPPHVQYVCLDTTDLQGIKQKRFGIRTPPSPGQLSTAECLALVVSRVENDPEIYETIMKPLDLMVEQWHGFANQKKEKRQK